MSTPTVTRTPPEVIEYAHAVMCTAREMEWPEDRHARKPVAAAFVTLGDAVDLYETLRDDIIHPERIYPDLTGHPEQKHAALVLAAQDAEEAAETLMTALASLVPAGAAAAGQGAGG